MSEVRSLETVSPTPEMRVQIIFSTATVNRQFPGLPNDPSRKQSFEEEQRVKELQTRIHQRADSSIRLQVPETRFSLSVEYSAPNEMPPTTDTASAEVPWWNSATTVRWLSGNWSALLMIFASTLALVFVLTTGRKKRHPSTNPMPGSERLRTVSSTSNSITATTNRSQQRGSRVPGNLRPAESAEDKKLQQEITEYIREHPGQASEILQEWMKDAA